MKQAFFIVIVLFSIGICHAADRKPQKATLSCNFDFKWALDTKEKLILNIDLTHATASEEHAVLNPKVWSIRSHTTVDQGKLDYMGQEIKASANSSAQMNQIILMGGNGDDTAYTMVVTYDPATKSASAAVISSSGGTSGSDQSSGCSIKY